MKKLSITNFTTGFLKLLFKWTPVERSLRSLLRSLIVKLLIGNVFIKSLGITPPGDGVAGFFPYLVEHIQRH